MSLTISVSFGRVTKRSQPDADTTRSKYDTRGNLRFSQEARQAAAGTVTFLVYDAVKRVTRIGEASATFSTLKPDSTYAFETSATAWKTKRAYDVDYLGSGGNYAQGRLTKLEENTNTDSTAEVTVLLAYNRDGTVRAQQVTIAGLTAKLVQYAYDLVGRVTRVVYPDGREVRSRYDSAGRVSTVTDVNGTPYATYTYTSDGNLATHTVGNNLVTGTYTYTLREWLNDFTYPNAFRDSTGYDGAGNVTLKKYQQGTGAAKTATYGYDPLHRLVGFHLPVDSKSDSFSYDLNGNLTARITNGVTTTYQYTDAPHPNRLTSTSGPGGMNYGYNANGWMVSRGADTLYYDYRGLATGYKKAPSILTNYLSDSDGQRVKKAATAGDTLYSLRGIDGAVLAEYDRTGTLTATYMYAGGTRIVQLTSSGTHYFLTDHLGSTRALLSATGGSPTTTYDYWPYGEVLLQGGSEGTRFKFTGQERDGESGLDYLPARLYDNTTGRFLRLDPLADVVPHLSPYSYGPDNPLGGVDPTGEEWIYENGRRIWQVDEIVVYADRERDPEERYFAQIYLGLPGKDPFEKQGSLLFSDYYNNVYARDRLVRLNNLDAHEWWKGGRTYSVLMMGAIPLATVLVSKGTPALGRKLDFMLGRATGNAHNILRSQDMLRQLERIGLHDNEATREVLKEHFAKVLSSTDNILRTQSSGRVVKESLLIGPQGGVKIESLWEGNKLITVKIFGGR